MAPAPTDFIEFGPFNIMRTMYEMLLFVLAIAIVISILMLITWWWQNNVSKKTTDKLWDYTILISILVILCNSFALPGNYIVKNDEVHDARFVTFIPFIDKVYQIPKIIKMTGHNKYTYPIIWADGVRGGITFDTIYFTNNGVANPEKVLDNAINTILIDKYHINLWTSEIADNEHMRKTYDDPLKHAMNSDITEYLWNHGLVPAYTTDLSNCAKIHFINKLPYTNKYYSNNK